MSLKILIAEEKLLAELLVHQLVSMQPGAIVTCITTAEEILKLPADSADLIVTDLKLTDGCTLPWANSWSARNPKGRVIILTSREEEFALHKVLTSSIAGIVHKADGLAALELAMRAVTSGGTFFSPRIQAIRAQMNADPNFFSKILSIREQSVLQLIGEGRTVQEIARALGLKSVTVIDHRKNIMRKLDIHSQSDLLAYAVRKGFGQLQTKTHR